VFRQVITTLYIFQLVMIALLIVKRFVWVVLLLIPLAVTIVVHRIGSGFLQRSWGVMSMRTAHELDVADAAAAAAAAPDAAGKQHVQEDVPAPMLDRGAATVGDVSTLSKNSRLGRPRDVCGDGGDGDGSSRPSAGQQGSVGPDSEVQPEVKQQCGSLAAAWGELYRSPGQRVLLTGPRIEAGLAEQVAVMKQRLAQHNAVVAGCPARAGMV